MLNTSTPTDPTIVKAKAWRVVFEQWATAADNVLIIIREPRHIAASLIPIDIEDALAAHEPEDLDSLEIIWMPPDVNDPSTIEGDVLAWVSGGGEWLRKEPLRAGIRTARVLWNDARALVYTSAEELHDTLVAILHFTIEMRETIALELVLLSMWPTIAADTAFTRTFTSWDENCQRHISRMTERFSRMKVIFLRLSMAQLHANPRFRSASKLLCSELALAADLPRRLEKLDEPIQFAIDTYELANTRFREASHSAQDRILDLKGHSLERWIIALLTMEVILFIWEIVVLGG